MEADAISVVLHGCERDEDVARWDEWIGRGEFDFGFLRAAFASTPWIVRMTRADVLVGIMLVATRFPGVHEIVLLSKEHNSAERGVGTRLLQYASSAYRGLQIVHDHSELPGFYSKRHFRAVLCMPEWCVRVAFGPLPATESPGVAASPRFASVLTWTQGLARACPFSTCTAGL